MESRGKKQGYWSPGWTWICLAEYRDEGGAIGVQGSRGAEESRGALTKRGNYQFNMSAVTEGQWRWGAGGNGQFDKSEAGQCVDGSFVPNYSLPCPLFSLQDKSTTQLLSLAQYQIKQIRGWVLYLTWRFICLDISLLKHLYWEKEEEKIVLINLAQGCQKPNSLVEC